MADLQVEFDKLVAEMHIRIREKQLNEDLTKEEADELALILEERLSGDGTGTTDRAWNSSSWNC